MNKSSYHYILLSAYLALLIFAMTSPWQKAVGQTSDAGDGKPVLPLVSTPPGYAQWKIVFSPLAPPVPGNSDPAIKEMDFIKSPSLASQVIILTDGKTTENWIAEGYLLTKTPDRPDIYLSSIKQRPEGFSNDSEDFNVAYPGFSWLNLKYYKGVVQIKSKKCHHYANGTSQAWVQVDTNLPVAYSDETTHGIYEFLAPPTSELKMPDKFSRLLRNYKTAMDR